MKLEDNEIDWIVNNENIPENIRRKIVLEKEKDKVKELLNTENSGFNMNGIKEILEILINNETAIRDISEYIHKKYPNEYLCNICNEWENGCKLKKINYDECNELYESTKLNRNV